MALADTLRTLWGSGLARQFRSFAAIGLLAVATHYSVFLALLTWGGMPPVAATTIGFLSGGVVSYAFNQWLTFTDRPHLLRGLATFFALISIGAVFNALIFGGLVRIGVHYLLAQAAATGLVLFWNFFVSRTFVFKARSPSPTPVAPS
ncbi:GtrA family protein [Sphingomonas sp. AP4-R1]|uniref:GtrA family protein n=1 Tax=Sphingomonas sp. AP4-R1 TaxID=2735134 RepID=UPI0014939B70|nr:GtrA family protein [Sphingomonas sp. AP4-R1]QJU56386.1 GtrA family protein [Sphingomonas sp. AP4-R1]